MAIGRIEIFTKPGADKFKGNLAYNYATDWWNSRNPYASQKAPLLLNEFENSIGGPLSRKSSFTLDFQRQLVDNGYIVNGVTLNSAMLPSAYNAIYKTPQRRINVSPRVDYQLNPANTVIFRYTFANSEVNGAGIGGFDLASRGYKLNNLSNTAQASDTYVHGNLVNEIRFQYFRLRRATTPFQTGPEIQVLGAFNDGGASVGKGRDVQNSYELQNYDSLLRGAHMFRFGVRMREALDDNSSLSGFNGTYTFSSIDAYRATLLGTAGAGPAQFSVTTGSPLLSVRQFDVGIFGGDDWRARPNLTVSYGFRYEAQTNLGDRSNIAPRVGIAWAPGHAQQKKTVIRAGFGMFYDRFALANTLASERFNGVLQQQYVLATPGTSFFPNVPTGVTLAGTQSPSIRQEIDAHIRSPYLMQAAFTVERQLSKTTTLAATYTNSHGVHVLRSFDINAPKNGVYPYGGNSPIFLATSTGIYNQNQLIVSVNTKPLPQVSLFGYYVANRAMSDSDGLGTFPGNPYNWSGEYGPAATDVRHRMLVGGTLNARWNIRLSPFFTMQSGSPFDITTGQDLFGTSLFNSRPGIATATTPGAILTSYGYLDPRAAAGETITAAQLRTRSGAGELQSATIQGDRIRSGKRRLRECRWTGAGGCGCHRQSRWNTRPLFRTDQRSAIQPGDWHVRAQRVEPQQSWGDRRQHHLFALRAFEPTRGRAEWRGLFRKRQQSPPGTANQNDLVVCET